MSPLRVAVGSLSLLSVPARPAAIAVDQGRPCRLRPTASLLVLLLSASIACEIYSQVDFVRYENNPVLGDGDPLAWDRAGFSPSVIKDGGLYKMWFQAQVSAVYQYFSAIGYAWSDDGLSWHKHPEPVIRRSPAGAGRADESYVGLPCVLKDPAGVYRMWYSARCEAAACNKLLIMHATSEDGIVWTKYRSNSSPYPVLRSGASGSWDDSGVWGARVVLDGSGVYWMWYTGDSNRNPASIGLATSTDGTAWRKHGSNPVLRPDPWASNAIIPAVISRGDVFEMFYAGWTGTVFRLSYATSANGVHWAKFAGNPFLQEDQPGAWDQQGVFNPAILLDDEPALLVEDPVYKLWYTGRSSEEADTWDVGYAEAPWTVPIIRFTARPTAEDRFVVLFDASETAAPPAVSVDRYEWDFGDGSAEETVEPQATHRYRSEGTFAAMLTVTYGSGEKHSVTRTVTVSRIPGPRFLRGDSNDDGDVDISDGIRILGFLFLGASDISCLKAADADDSAFLDLTDAVYIFGFLFLGGPPPPLPFPSCGVDVTPVVPEESCESYASCPEPVASFDAAPTSGKAPLEVSFDASTSTGMNAAIDRYEWDFGDGQVDEGVTVTHVYQLPGTYSATLTVTDTDGLTAIEGQTVAVQEPNRPPAASFSFTPLVALAPVRVNFNASASSDADGDITTYHWDFGDGDTATAPVISHVYRSAGEFTVTLTVTDDDGATTASSETYVATELEYDPRFRPLVTRIVAEMTELEAPGAAVAVVEAGEVTFAAGFGSKHPRRSDPVEPTTLFRIASLTKMLTSVGVLQLVEQGQVDLGAPITHYLPEFSFSRNETWAPSIAVGDLLMHSSGIFDHLTLDDPELTGDSALREYMNGAYGDAELAYLMAPAGRMWNYTNTGFMLAGLVTETVSGAYYREYMRANVFEPLQMNRTYFLPEEALADGDVAYGKSGGSVIAPDTHDNGWARPAGYAFSSVLDLARFVTFLRDGDPAVLADEGRLAMQDRQLDTDLFVDFLHYGYGLFVYDAGFFNPPGTSNFYEVRVVAHGGDLPGFSANVYYAPDLDFGIVVLVNASGSHLYQSIFTALHTLADMPDPSPPPNLSMNPAVDYVAFEGDYCDPNALGPVTVRRVGNDLRVQVPLFDELSIPYDPVLAPYNPDNFTFYIGNYSYRVTFVRGDDGRGEYFRTRYFVAARDEVCEGQGAGASRRLSWLRHLPPEPEPPPFTRPLDW